MPSSSSVMSCNIAQEAFVILERVLSESERPASGHGNLTQSDRDYNLAATSALLLRPAECAGFVTGWPFVSGVPGAEVGAR